VPGQFDDLVLRATARDPAQRYTDAHDMADDLDEIVDELGLPPFRVPAPRNSAQHASLAMARAPEDPTVATARPVPAAPRQHTRELTRDDMPPVEYQPVSGQFAGINLDEFQWARQRAKRALVFWVLAVLTLTALLAAGAWSLGDNINGLLQTL
jgi:serine/threonine-protein kinase